MAEDFASHIPTLLAGAAATVIATTAVSFLPFGPKGTVIALAAGSIITSGATFWLDRLTRKSVALAKAARGRRRPLTDRETMQITAVVDRRLWGQWRLYAVMGLAVLALSAGIITGWELLAGKPVSAVVQRRPGHGLSVGGGGTSPAPSHPALAPRRRHTTVVTTPPAQVVTTPPASPTPSSQVVTPAPSATVTPSDSAVPLPSSGSASPQSPTGAQ